jgi:hypothetical protein
LAVYLAIRVRIPYISPNIGKITQLVECLIEDQKVESSYVNPLIKRVKVVEKEVSLKKFGAV